jgi:hypothetical protein
MKPLIAAASTVCLLSVGVHAQAPQQTSNAALRYWMAFALLQDSSASAATMDLLVRVAEGSAPWNEGRLGPILDGLMRNTPDALRFIERAKTEGVRAVIEDRDGPFGDYSQAPKELQPDPKNVIEP